MNARSADQIRFSERDYREQAAFRSALRTFLALSEQHARAAGITPQQYLLLLVTRGHPSYPVVSIRNLTEALKLQQPTVSLLVDRAVHAGLVDRKENPDDRRTMLVTLTEKGQRTLDQVMAANREVIAVQESALFPEALRAALPEVASAS